MFDSKKGRLKQHWDDWLEDAATALLLLIIFIGLFFLGGI